MARQPEIPLGPRVLYICSASRCGSTVTDMFLGGHSRIASLGEANFLGKSIQLGQRCTCGAQVKDCAEWAKVFDKLSRDEPGVDLRSRPYAWPLWSARSRVKVDRQRQTLAFHLRFRIQKAALILRSKLPESMRHRVSLPHGLELAVRNKIRLYNAVASSWQKDVVVDSSKNPFEAIELARRYQDKVTVVLLTRDGRGVFLSRCRSGVGRHRASKDWARYYERALKLLKNQVPAGSLVNLTYENLASKPAMVGQRLCERVGLTYEPAMEQLGAATRHMVDGNDTRFSNRSGIVLDERWKNELSHEEIEYFERHAGRLNRDLGYV